MKYYITTPIYYINDIPHIGHAYTSTAADVLARYHRNLGDEVFFLTGTDEHGAKIAEAAAAANLEPKQFADTLVPKFQAMAKKLNISYDEFFRTTDPQHETLVQDFVTQLQTKGFVEKRKYEGLYCVGCEKFLKESDLVDGLCHDHKKAPVAQTEENYFFKLSAFGDQLLAKINSGELEIGPDSRKNEVLGKIKQGLEDISISRQAVEWGISFPEDKSQTIYVWIDALLNYCTATKIYGKEDFWPANLHLVGKDILWFHAIIWPALLMALNLPTPKKVFAHGFFTVNGGKMSKTIGNVIDPIETVEKYGTDAVRYALLSEFPFGEDGDISLAKIESLYNKLANNIGNLFQRTISMINKYEVVIPTSSVIPAQAGILPNKQLPIGPDLDNLDFMGAIRKIDKFAEETNQFIAEKQPWTLTKEGKKSEVEAVLLAAYDNLTIIAETIAPFTPETAEKMKKQLETLEPQVLFPRLDTDS
ncbi:MAG: methionine--tRNA ligase [Candidatus Berkelbacteria bacterium]